MRGAATQALSVHIVEERQKSRCPPAAAPPQAAATVPLVLLLAPGLGTCSKM